MSNEPQTGTLVFDPATVSKALTALNEHILSGLPWVPMNNGSPEGAIQKRYLQWYAYNAPAVEALSDLNVKVDTTAAPLNAFLQEHGFNPMFREISPGGVGACAILDMLVEWAVQAQLTNFNVYAPDYHSQTTYTAFEVPRVGIEVFETVVHGQRLVKLNTKDGGAVWLVMCDRPNGPIDMIDDADRLMHDMKPVHADEARWISSVIVPTLEIDQEADLSWMLGASSGDHIIDQAFQMFKLRMNHEGARVKTASGLGTMRGAPRTSQPITFNQPFLGWFTQPSSTTPVGIFYADKDSWKAPQGSLSDL